MNNSAQSFFTTESPNTARSYLLITCTFCTLTFSLPAAVHLRHCSYYIFSYHETFTETRTTNITISYDIIWLLTLLIRQKYKILFSDFTSSCCNHNFRADFCTLSITIQSPLWNTDTIISSLLHAQILRRVHVQLWPNRLLSTATKSSNMCFCQLTFTRP